LRLYGRLILEAQAPAREQICVGKESAMTLLESLKKQTIIVADTGDIEAIAQHKPQDATTNPSLLLKAAQQPPYRALVDEALKFAGTQSGDEPQRKSAFMEKLAVNFGGEILKIIPGRVSTEVDASFSFDTEGTIAKARHYIDLYRKAGVDKERILIKIGTTRSARRGKGSALRRFSRRKASTAT
jgi:transaldolase